MDYFIMLQRHYNTGLLPVGRDTGMSAIPLAMTETTEETKPCVVIIRPEFMKICNNDACKAATLNHALYWIAQKIKKGIQYWYATGEQIWEGMNKSWGITTIRKAVKELVGAGFLGQRRNPKVGIDQTRQYFFGKEQVANFIQACEEKHVCLLCMDIHKDVSHLIDLSNGDLPFDRIVNCICQNCQMQLTDLSEQYQRLLTKITDKESVIPGESSGESTISSSSEDEIATRYKKGHAAIQITSGDVSFPVTLDELEATATRLLTEAVQDIQPPKISTAVIHSVDTSSHIATMPTRKEGGSHAGIDDLGDPDGHRDSGVTGGDHHGAGVVAQEVGHVISNMAATTSALQAKSTKDDTHSEHATMAGATRSPTRETRKPRQNKNGGLTLQGQHILDEYQKFKGRKSTPGKATIEAANNLVGLVANDEEFVSVLTEIRDNKFLNDNNIARDLDFVFRKYEHYRDIVEQKASKRQPNGRPAPPPGIKDYTGMGRLLHTRQQGAQA